MSKPVWYRCRSCDRRAHQIGKPTACECGAPAWIITQMRQTAKVAPSGGVVSKTLQALRRELGR